MEYQQNCDPLVLCGLADFSQPGARGCVDSGHGFVHDEELWLADQCARNEYALLLPARKNVEWILRAMYEADGTQCVECFDAVAARVPPLARAEESGENNFNAR